MNLELPKVPSLVFGNDSKMAEVSADITILIAFTLQRGGRPIFGSNAKKEQTEYRIRPFSSVICGYKYGSFKTYREQMFGAY
ncbi:hypothetical protein TNCV_4423231 [Trichonephila clavipes]|nr:hypothetical protein TNCV_4423231 [Trichonephila clavipes]